MELKRLSELNNLLIPQRTLSLHILRQSHSSSVAKPIYEAMDFYTHKTLSITDLYLKIRRRGRGNWIMSTVFTICEHKGQDDTCLLLLFHTSMYPLVQSTVNINRPLWTEKHAISLIDTFTFLQVLWWKYLLFNDSQSLQRINIPQSQRSYNITKAKFILSVGFKAPFSLIN